MRSLGIAAFIAVFVGLAVLVVVAARRQRKEWLARAAALRDLAQRRHLTLDEMPANAGELIPRGMHKLQSGDTQIELPVVVRGKGPEGDFRVFDVHVTRATRPGHNKSITHDYHTYVTVAADSAEWPRFEFAAISDAAENSPQGRLMAAVGAAAEFVAGDGGLTHIPVMNHPGYQLYVGDPGRGQTISDALMRVFAQKVGWTVSAEGKRIGLAKADPKQGASKKLVPTADLDAFLDEALGIARTLRSALVR